MVPIILARSGRLPIIGVQHSTPPRAALDGCSPVSNKLFLDDEPIVQTLVGALAVIRFNKFVDGLAQGAFSEQNHPLQARLLDGSDKALGVGTSALARNYQGVCSREVIHFVS